MAAKHRVGGRCKRGHDTNDPAIGKPYPSMVNNNVQCKICVRVTHTERYRKSPVARAAQSEAGKRYREKLKSLGLTTRQKLSDADTPATRKEEN